MSKTRSSQNKKVSISQLNNQKNGSNIKIPDPFSYLCDLHHLFTYCINQQE